MIIIRPKYKFDIARYISQKLFVFGIFLLGSILVLTGCSTGDSPIDSEPLSPASPLADLSGVWSTNSFDTLDSPDWDIVGQFSSRLTVETYEYLETLLYNLVNDHLSASEILLRNILLQ